MRKQNTKNEIKSDFINTFRLSFLKVYICILMYILINIYFYIYILPYIRIRLCVCIYIHYILYILYIYNHEIFKYCMGHSHSLASLLGKTFRQGLSFASSAYGSVE